MTTPSLANTSLIGRGYAPRLAGGGQTARLGGLKLGSLELAYEQATPAAQTALLNKLAAGVSPCGNDLNCNVCGLVYPVNERARTKAEHMLAHASHAICGSPFGAMGLIKDAVDIAFTDMPPSVMDFHCMAVATGLSSVALRKIVTSHVRTVDFGKVEWTLAEAESLSRRFIRRFNVLDDDGAFIGGIRTVQALIRQTAPDPASRFNHATAVVSPYQLYNENVRAARSRLGW